MEDLGTIGLEKKYKERISGYVKGAVCGEYRVSLILGIGLIFRGIVWSRLLGWECCWDLNIWLLVALLPSCFWKNGLGYLPDPWP